MGDEVVDQHVVPAVCSNDEDMELHTVLSGKVIGQLASAAVLFWTLERTHDDA